MSGDSDQLCSAAALHSGDKPSGPPISKHTSRPSFFQPSNCSASCGVVQGLPGISNVTTLPFPQAASIALPSCSKMRLISAFLPRLPAGISMSSKGMSLGKRRWYSSNPVVTQAGIFVPTAINVIFILFPFKTPSKLTALYAQSFSN